MLPLQGLDIYPNFLTMLTFISFLANAREIYYRDPELFQNQNVVNRYLDDLAFSFGVRRASLNVVGYIYL